jgi:hypothetical protein
MFKTHFLTSRARSIYSDGRDFYVQREHGWRRLPNSQQVYTWVWEPNNGNYTNVNLFGEGSVSHLKRLRNRAARTIQRIERGRASRKRTAFAQTPFGLLPNNVINTKIFGRR